MPAQATIEVPDELFDASESSSFQGNLDLPVLTSGPDTYEFAEPLAWEVLVVPSGDKELLVTGTVRGTATGFCGRCLESFELPLTGEIEGYWLTEDPGEDIPDELAEDEFEVLDESKRVDLAPFITAALVLALPFIPLCREDCKGLCPQCGQNLNEGSCDCADGEGDGIDPNNPFAVLKDLEFPGEN